MIHWYRASPLKLAEPDGPIPMPSLPLDKLTVPQPHLLLWAAGDTALLPEVTEGLEDFAPRLTRVTLPEGDHWVHHQHPDAVASAILNWTD